MNTIKGMIEDLRRDETHIGGCTTKGELIIALESLERNDKYSKEIDHLHKYIAKLETRIVEQDSVLDDVSAEIEEIETYDGIYIDRAYVLQIIDKYKIESEVKKNEEENNSDDICIGAVCKYVRMQ